MAAREARMMETMMEKMTEKMTQMMSRNIGAGGQCELVYMLVARDSLTPVLVSYSAH